MNTKFITYQGKHYGLHFGMEFLAFFCGERGRTFKDLDAKDDMNVLKDLVYSFVRAYAELNNEKYDLKPLSEWALMFEMVKQPDILEAFNVSMNATVPEQKQIAVTDTKKKK